MVPVEKSGVRERDSTLVQTVSDRALALAVSVIRCKLNSLKSALHVRYSRLLSDTTTEHSRPKRHAGWRLARFCAGMVTVLVLLVCMAIGGLMWRLASGPLEVQQIGRIAEDLMSKSLGPDAHARIGLSSLDWSWKSYGFIIRLQSVEASGPTGGVQITVPSADIEVRTLPMIWGAVKPARLNLNAPSIRIDLTKLDPAKMAEMSGNGAQPVALASAPAPSPSPNSASPDLRPAIYRLIEQSVRGLSDALDVTHSEGFIGVTVEHGIIDVARLSPQGQMVHVTMPDISIDGNFAASGNVDLSFSAKGEVGRWGMRLRKMRGADGHSRRLLFEGNDATARDLVGQLPPDVILDIPIYPTIDALIDDSGQLSALSVDLKLGAGQFHFGKYPEDEMLIDEGQIAAHWDAGSQSFIVDQAGASTGPTTVSVKGRITPPPANATGAAAHAWTYDLGLDKGVLHPRDAGGDALPVDFLHLGGTIDQTGLQLLIDDMDARFGGSEIKGAGRIDFAREKPQIIVTFALSPTDWTVIRRAWPSFIAAGARNWFLKQVTAGRITDGAIKLDLPMFTEPKFLPSTAITFSGKIQGGAFRTFGDLPDAVGLDGQFSSLNRQFQAIATKGQGATKFPRKPDVLDMRLIIADSYQRSPKGHIEFRLVGENGAIGEIANAEPLAILDDAGIKLEGIQGSADVIGTVDMILEDNPKPEQIDFRVEATLDRFGSPSPILGRKFQDANVKVVADPKGTSVVGKAKIDGVATDVNLYEPRVKTKTNERRDFKLTLDEATRQRMGLDLSTFLSGSIQVAITQNPGGNEKARHIEADLTTARLTLSAFGWSKGTGVPAKATLDILDDDKGTHLENVSVESEGIQIKGRADLDKDRRPLLLDLAKFSLRKGDDAKVHLQRQPDQSILASFDATTFDLRGLIQVMKHQGDTSDPEKSKLPDIQLKAKLARAIGFNDVSLTDAVLDTSIHQGIVTRMALSGQISGGRMLNVQIKPEGANRVVLLDCNDAGAFLSFVDIYDRMHDGGISLKADISAPGVAEGGIRVLGFRLDTQVKATREPVVEPDGTRTLPIRQAAPTDPSSFDKFSANYALRKGVITMTEGVARGATTGATASGQIDLNNQKIQIKGTYIPLYGLNNLVGRIPVLGEIVGAGRNEGLVGVTFKVIGSVDDPVLQVNPISAIAPGIFRRIFEYNVDDPHAPQDAQKDNSSN